MVRALAADGVLMEELGNESLARRGPFHVKGMKQTHEGGPRHRGAGAINYVGALAASLCPT